jgi:signal transduction histidine kinase
MVKLKLQLKFFLLFLLLLIIPVEATLLASNSAKVDAWLILIIVVLVSLLLSTYLAKRVSTPAIRISEAISEFGRGNFSSRINLKTGDEFESLAENFNRAADALKQIDTEHKELEEAKTRFLSIISHELRSPMTSIKGQAELLQKGYEGKLTPKQKNAIDTILRNANRLDGIIVDMLDISRIEAARLKLNYAKIDITPKMIEVVEEMQLQANQRDIKIETEIHSIPIIEIDSDRIAQILRNLIGNAIKFSKDKGKIIVHAEPGDHGIEFRVQDFGIGIPRDHQDRLFEPFFQVEQTIYRKYGGTGLGLAICKGIIQSMGGKIWFKSYPGKGTTFFFTVPAKPPKEIKPFNVLLTREKEIERLVRHLFLEYLGPVGEVGFLDLTKKGMKKRNVEKYLSELKEKKIIKNDVHDVMIHKLKEIFGDEE